jgi:hypothetical protein
MTELVFLPEGEIELRLTRPEGKSLTSIGWMWAGALSVREKLEPMLGDIRIVWM